MPKSDFTWLEKYVLMKTHPRKILIDSIAVLWGVFFLWNHQWQSALAVVFTAAGLGFALVRGANFDYMAQTLLGKIAILHMHPINLSLQILGAIGIGYAIWNHSTLGILSGLTIVLLGHLWGWSQVNKNL